MDERHDIKNVKNFYTTLKRKKERGGEESQFRI